MELPEAGPPGFYKREESLNQIILPKDPSLSLSYDPFIVLPASSVHIDLPVLRGKVHRGNPRFCLTLSLQVTLFMGYTLSVLLSFIKIGHNITVGSKRTTYLVSKTSLNTETLFSNACLFV